MVSPRMTIRYVLFVLAIPVIFVLAVLAVRILISQDDPAAVEELMQAVASGARPAEQILYPSPARDAQPGEPENPAEDPRISALLDTVDPLERRYLLRELLKEVHSREDFERLGFTSAMLECEDPDRAESRTEPSRVYDILSLLAGTNQPWAHEYVADLARSSKAAAVAQAILFAHDGQQWAQQGLERVYAELRTQEDMPWQFLNSAAEAGSSWGDEFYLREYRSASPEVRAEWARHNMLSEYRHLAAAEDVRQVAFLTALRDPDPIVHEGAVAFLLDESHLVHPNGTSWSTGLLMDAFNEGDAAGQVAILEATRNILLSRLEAGNNSAQLGNTTAIDTLLRQALASQDAEVREVAQGTLDAMAGAVDIEVERERIP